jgi:hypothetical protein
MHASNSPQRGFYQSDTTAMLAEKLDFSAEFWFFLAAIGSPIYNRSNA